MTAYEKIVEAIKGFNYPYEPERYTGSDERYFTYNYADERPSLFADDRALEVTASVQIHFYLPKHEKFSKLKREIKEALQAHGFTYPEVTILTEEKKRHLIFECDVEVEMEDE